MESRTSESYAMRFLRRIVNKKNLREDLIAGSTVGLVLIPQSLAYAQLAGLPPQFGLYAAMLPPVIAAGFGSSRHLSTGPVAVLSLMTFAAVTPLASVGSPEYIAYAIILAFLLGVFQLLLGFLKLGELVSFLSHPVIYGFTNAAAIIIATSQLSSFFGVSVPAQTHHYQTVIAVLAKAFNSFDSATFGLGMIAISSMLLIKRTYPKQPAVLMVVIGMTCFTWLTNFTTPVIGEIPRGLPLFSIPRVDFDTTVQLFLPMVTMALIGFTEAISVAQAIAIKTKQRLEPDKELIGQGLANILGSITGSYPVSGSFSRTALNYQTGAISWISSLITSLMVVVTLLFFTDLLYYLPKVVLAATILYSVLGLIDFSKIFSIWKVSRFDGIAAILTFFGTLYFAPDLEMGVILGIIFSIGHFVYRNTHPKVAFLSRYKDGSFIDSRLFHLDQCQNIAVVRLDAPLFFANATFFENEIIKYLAQHKHITDVLFAANGINDVDATGEEMLHTFIGSLQKTHKHVFFSTVKEQVLAVFQKSGLYQQVGERNFFATTKEAIEYMLTHMAHKHQHADQSHCPLRKYIHAPAETDTHRHHREKIIYKYQKLFHPQMLFVHTSD